MTLPPESLPKAAPKEGNSCLGRYPYARSIYPSPYSPSQLEATLLPHQVAAMDSRPSLSAPTEPRLQLTPEDQDWGLWIIVLLGDLPAISSSNWSLWP